MSKPKLDSQGLLVEERDGVFLEYPLNPRAEKERDRRRAFAFSLEGAEVPVFQKLRLISGQVIGGLAYGRAIDHRGKARPRQWWSIDGIRHNRLLVRSVTGGGKKPFNLPYENLEKIATNDERTKTLKEAGLGWLTGAAAPKPDLADRFEKPTGPIPVYDRLLAMGLSHGLAYGAARQGAKVGAKQWWNLHQIKPDGVAVTSVGNDGGGFWHIGYGQLEKVATHDERANLLGLAPSVSARTRPTESAPPRPRAPVRFRVGTAPAAMAANPPRAVHQSGAIAEERVALPDGEPCIVRVSSLQLRAMAPKGRIPLIVTKIGPGRFTVNSEYGMERHHESNVTWAKLRGYYLPAVGVHMQPRTGFIRKLEQWAKT